MTRDDILHMARKAGFIFWSEGERQGKIDWACEYDDDLERFAALVAQRERQAILEYIEESLGSEDKRNPHLAEGFNWGLDYIETFIRDRNK